MTPWDVALGIVLGGAGLACVAGLVLGAVMLASNLVVAVQRERDRRRQALLDAHEERENARRARIRFEERWGPFVRLFDAIEAMPSGRIQITRDELDRYIYNYNRTAGPMPHDADVDRYLNDRWPGLELWRETDVVELGVILRWEGRP